MDSQRRPRKNKHPSVFKYAHKILKAREKKGIETYGVSLQPFNGRDALWDAVEEAADLFVYLAQAYFEKEAKRRGKTPKLKSHRPSAR